MMPSLRHHFHLTWDEVEAMPLAELDEHDRWLARLADQARRSS